MNWNGTYNLRWTWAIGWGNNWEGGAICDRFLLSGNLCAMLCQPLLDLLGSLDLDLLGRTLSTGQPPWWISSSSLSLRLGCVEVLDDALVMLLDDVLRDALHAEDLDVESLPVSQSILDAGQIFLVDLVHVNRETYEYDISNCAG